MVRHCGRPRVTFREFLVWFTIVKLEYSRNILSGALPIFSRLTNASASEIIIRLWLIRGWSTVKKDRRIFQRANRWLNYSFAGKWPEECQKGEHQSPINLQMDGATERNFHDFKFIHYDDKQKASVTNNGHTGNHSIYFCSEQVSLHIRNVALNHANLYVLKHTTINCHQMSLPDDVGRGLRLW